MSPWAAALLVFQVSLGTWIVLHMLRWGLSRLVWFVLLWGSALARACQTPAQAASSPSFETTAWELYEKIPFVFK